MMNFDPRVLGQTCSRHSGNASYEYVLSELCSVREKSMTGEVEVLEVQKPPVLPVPNLRPSIQKLEPNPGDMNAWVLRVPDLRVPNLKPTIQKLEPNSGDKEIQYQKLKSCCSTRSLESFHSASSKSDDDDEASSQASAVCASIPSNSSTKSQPGDSPLSSRTLRKSSTCTILPPDTSGMTRHYSDNALLPHQVQVALQMKHIEHEFSHCRHQLTHLIGKGKLGSAPEYLKLCDDLTSLCSEALDISCRRDVPGAMDLFEDIGNALEEVVRSMDVHCGASIAALPVPMPASRRRDADSKPSSGSCIMFQCLAGVSAVFARF